MSHKITLDEANKRLFEKHGNNISILDFLSLHNYATFECNICGNKWTTIALSVLFNGSGCRVCSNKKLNKKFRISYFEVKRYIEENGCQLITPENEYKNSKKKVNIQFECGHTKGMTFEVFKRGIRCECDMLDRFKNSIEKKTRKRVLDKLFSLNFTFVSFENDFATFRTSFTYICNKGHTDIRNIRNFLSKPRCTVCSRIFLSEFQKGELGNNWQGGITKLTSYTKKAVWQWRKASIKSCNGTCIISGKKYETIHHLYSFTKILREALKEFELEEYEFIGDYDRKDLQFITDKVEELHWKYPLGVCLTKPIHKLFHKLYGERDFIPEDLYEFQSRIQSGEIQIPD